MAREIESYSLHGFPASASDEKSSLLYMLLPKIVRTRIQRIPSLRQSISQYALGSERCSPAPSSRASSPVSSVLRTPPPGYESRASLSELPSDNESDDDLPLRPLSSCSSNSQVENDSNIRWKFANQGLSLLNISAQEDKRRPCSTSSSPTSLSRQLYVHGITYMLRGLPTDMTVDEKMSIWSSIPHDVQQVSPIVDATNIVQSSESQVKPHQEQGSMLQRIVASLIVQLFITMQLLLPYVKYYCAILYKYERQHRISERMLASSMQLGEGMMKTGLHLTDAIYQMGDGKVGRSLNDLSIWWIAGVTAGIHQGVGEGLAIIGTKEGALDALQSKRRR